MYACLMPLLSDRARNPGILEEMPWEMLPSLNILDCEECDAEEVRRALKFLIGFHTLGRIRNGNNGSGLSRLIMEDVDKHR
jgi:hypothetical protein